jgi:hypothetical protein
MIYVCMCQVQSHIFSYKVQLLLRDIHSSFKRKFYVLFVETSKALVLESNFSQLHMVSQHVAEELPELWRNICVLQLST